jgi:pimeloyl-ACP methyl ester carboxylesterase
MINVAPTPHGVIEYRLEGQGDKVAVLLYGGHTNVNTRLGEEYFLEQGYKVLVVSRPGYGKTPLSTGKTPDGFADALAELLQQLGVPRVLVVGISAGGRTAIRFAARHANMTNRLILQGSISFAPYPGFLLRVGSHIGLRPSTEKYLWHFIHYFAKRNPEAAVKMLVSTLTILDPAKVVSDFSEKQTRELERLLATMSSGSGWLNDISTRGGDATDVEVPTLIIHSKSDKGVSPRHAYLLAKQIKGSKLYISEAESLLIWFSPHYSELKGVMDNFLET